MFKIQNDKIECKTLETNLRFATCFRFGGRVECALNQGRKFKENAPKKCSQASKPRFPHGTRRDIVDRERQMLSTRAMRTALCDENYVMQKINMDFMTYKLTVKKEIRLI